MTNYKAANGSNWSLVSELVSFESPKGVARFGLVSNESFLKPEAKIYCQFSVVTLVTKNGQPNQSVTVGQPMSRIEAETLLQKTVDGAAAAGWKQL